MNITEPFHFGPIRAAHIRYSLGGNAIVAIEADGPFGEDAEVVFDMNEAEAFYEWLGRALGKTAVHSTTGESK